MVSGCETRGKDVNVLQAAHPDCPPSCITTAFAEDEDWNVYDDFNNNTPAFRTDTPAGGSNYAGSDAGYFQKSGGDGASTPGLTPFGDYPSRQVPAGQQRNSTLIPADSFGFDARNADPRHLSYHAHNQEEEGIGGLHPAEPHMVAGHDPDKNESGIELVTVPALGQEFTKEEMKRMSRPYKKKEKVRRRKEAAKRWGKGEYKIGGWLNPRVAVFLAFIFAVLLGITLYFVIPRVPCEYPALDVSRRSLCSRQTLTDNMHRPPLSDACLQQLLS